MNSVEENTYDYIFIGTGMITILEAIYQNQCGKKVLMIDDQASLGGAWLPLNIFGYQDVENAIHYFLPDAKGFQFMKEVLGWSVSSSQAKFRIFEKHICGLKKVSYINPFGSTLSSIALGSPKRIIFKQLKEALRSTLKGERPCATYVEGGASEMLMKIKAILSKTSVQITYSTTIEDIFIDPGAGSVELKLKKIDEVLTVKGKAIYITHGSKIKSLHSPKGYIKIHDKIFPRPAAHILVNDDTPSVILEAIFTNNKLIKYAHEVTRFAQAMEPKKNQKIFVFALHPDVLLTENLFQELFQILKDADVIGKQARLLDHCWWDVFLPSLDDNDLEMIRQNFPNQVFILRTENFARGIGLYADRWVTKIKSLTEGFSYDA